MRARRPSLPADLLAAAWKARRALEALAGNGRLADQCVVATLLLRRLAKRRGYDLTVAAGVVCVSDRYGPQLQPHTWGEHDGAIVDLTATQFWRGVSGVYVVRDTHPRYPLVVVRGNDIWPHVVGPARVRESLREATRMAEAS